MSSATKKSLWRLIDLKTGGEECYASNAVRSSRYTALDFLPKTLLQQFCRVTNVWFLGIALLQTLGAYQDDSATWTTAAPLIALVCIRMMIDAYFDIRRHRMDYKNNNRLFQVWDGAGYIEKPCGELCVGNFVLLREGAKAPADMLIMAAGNSERSCYLDVSPCIGDHDLVYKRALKETSHVVNSLIMERASGQLNRLSGIVKVGEPTPDFNTLEATIKMPGSPKAMAIGLDNFIMRSAVIKAAPWLIALVVYTGIETKVLLNTQGKRRKVARVEEIGNRWMAGMAAATIVLSGLFALISLSESQSEQSDGFLRRFVTFLIPFSNFVPISLFVSLDIIRLSQLVFLRRDSRLSLATEFKSSDFTESLGQVEYIFLEPEAICEKLPSIDLLVVGEDEYHCRTVPEDDPLPLIKSPSRDLMRSGDEMVSTDINHLLVSEDGRAYLSAEITDLNTFEKLRRIGFEGGGTQFEQFFECIALSASIIPNDESQLQCAFTIDDSLEKTLKFVGCEIERRTVGYSEISFFGKMAHYEIVAYWEQTPTSKRTRVVVQRSGDPGGMFYVRGPLIVMGNVLGVTSHQFKQIEQTVNSLGTKGMAPLIAGGARLTPAKLEAFRKKVASVQLAVADVEVKMNKLFEGLEEEEDVQYLGIVGASIRTKEGAKETIKSFSDSGIKTWLMGSGSESKSLATAYSSGIVKPEHTIIHLKSFQSEETLQQELIRCIRFCVGGHMSDNRHFNYSLSDGGFLKGPHKASKSHPHYSTDSIDDLSYHPENLSYCLSIDQLSLQQALFSEQCRRYFAYLLFCASAVCFNSLIPAQKKEVIEFVKQCFSFRPVTLAVGSDASGMAMMQTADIGVAITDNSRFAELFSDLVLGDINDLGVLVLQHGQWNYTRISKVVLLFIFNSVLVTTALVWYSVMADFTGTVLIDYGLLAAYNVVFAPLAVVAVGVWDEHLDSVDLASVPMLYQDGIFNLSLTRRAALRCIVSAVSQSLLIVALLFPAVLPTLTDGKTETGSAVGVLFLIVLLTTAAVEASVQCESFTPMSVGMSAAALGLMFLYLGVEGDNDASGLQGALSFVFSAGSFLLSIFLAPLACFLLSYSFSAYKQLFHPSLLDCYRQGQVHSSLKRFMKSFPRLYQFKFHLKKVYKPTSAQQSNHQREPHSFDPLSLKFASEHVESQYQSLYFRLNVLLFRCVIVSVFLSAVAWLVVGCTVYEASAALTAVQVVSAAVFLGILGLALTKRFEVHYVAVTLALVGATLAAKFAAELIYLVVGSMTAVMIPMISYILLNVDFVRVTALNVANIVLFTISSSVVLDRSDFPQSVLRLLCYEVLLISLTVIAARAGYTIERANKVAYRIRSNTANEAERTRNILSLLLPPFVVSKVRKKREAGQFIAEDQGDVSVIFCDIYDFDSVCVLYKPQELTAFLDEVFMQFDDLCPLNGVVKVETVGKTYMACAGMNYIEQDLSEEMRRISHSRRAVEFAFDLLRTAASYKIKNGQSLRLKIGINSGPVISGVVGYHKPQFSLVGDTVNTASRMCSTLDRVNSIQITELCRNMMAEQQGLAFESRTVYAKGKGNVTTFIVTEIVDPTRLSDNSRTLQIQQKSDIIPSM